MRSDTGTLIDNLFADAWDSLNLSSLRHRAGIRKRGGVNANRSVYLLQELDEQILKYQKNYLLYDLIKRPDLNWRGRRAFVIDDTFKPRRSKKMDAVSLVAFDQGPATILNPVIAAAVLAFGFVYIHPFVDGDGRIHRDLIHHVLA